MKRIVAVMAIVAGTLAIWTGLKISHEARLDRPEPVVEQFLTAFLAGDQKGLHACTDAAANIDFPKDSAAAIEGVKFRVRGSQIDGDRATSKVTLVADKDFVRGIVVSLRGEAGWKVASFELEEHDRQEDAIDDLDELNDIPGVTVQSLGQ